MRTAVLMATKDGGSFVDEQFESLAAQSVSDVDIWVSDDGSSDETLDIIRRWEARWFKGRFLILAGPRDGFAANFRSLIINPDIEADYFAFCDQDDVWESNKLSAAIEWMQTQDDSRPLLFCSRTTTVSETGLAIGFSPLFGRSPSFRNALVQSIAGGNTMVMNRAARDLIREASLNSSFVSHDWWSYLIITGAGGVFHYSAEPFVRYRQHHGNQVGANSSMRSRISRIKRLFAGQLVAWLDSNLQGVNANRSLMTEDAINACAAFEEARTGGLMKRFQWLRESGVYRQTVLGTIALYVAFLTRRL